MEASGYGGTTSFRPMAREEDLTDQQFDELCQHYAPTYLHRPSERAAPAVPARTILTITYENGFPEFSDGSHHKDAKEETGWDSGTDTAAEEADAETDEDDSDDETTQAEETDAGSDAPTETDTDTD